MNYTRKAAGGAAVIFVMSVLAGVFSYLVRVTLARNLSTAEYGLFYAVFSFVLFFIMFRDFGLNPASSKLIAQHLIKKDHSKIKSIAAVSLTFQSISSMVLIAGILIAAPFLSKSYFRDPMAESLLQAFAFFIALSMLMRMVMAFFSGFQDFKWFAVIEPFWTMSTLGMILLFFRLGRGVMSPAYGYVAATLITLILACIGMSRYIHIAKEKIKDFWKTAGELFSFGLQVIISNIGNNVIGYLDILILTYLVSISAVGIYNAILPTALMFTLLGRTISFVLFPMISELWEKKDLTRIREGISIIYKYSFALIIPVIMAVFYYSEFFITLVFGSDYAAGANAFRILLIGIIFNIIGIVNNSSLGGIGKPAIVTRIILATAFLNVVFNIILIPKFKITGAAISTACSYALIMLFSSVYMKKHIRISFPFACWLKAAAAGVLFMLGLHLASGILNMGAWAEAAISVSIAGIIYLAAALLMGVIEVKEIKAIAGRLY